MGETPLDGEAMPKGLQPSLILQGRVLLPDGGLLRRNRESSRAG